MAVALLCIACIAWRLHGAPSPAARADERSASRLQVRAAGAAAVRVPRGWRQLDAGADHVTWGRSDRTRTVTVGLVPASRAPIAAVARAAADDLVMSIGRGRILDVQAAGSGDDRVVVDAEVRPRQAPPNARLAVRQSWRRLGDGRAAVATWTSTDGQWSTSVADSIPVHAAGRGAPARW